MMILQANLDDLISFSEQIKHQSAELTGSDFTPSDGKRLNKGYERLLEAMKEGIWMTPDAMAKESNTRIDSALRFWRYARQRGHTCNKKYMQNGLWLYQIIPASV